MGYRRSNRRKVKGSQIKRKGNKFQKPYDKFQKPHDKIEKPWIPEPQDGDSGGGDGGGGTRSCNCGDGWNGSENQCTSGCMDAYKYCTNDADCTEFVDEMWVSFTYRLDEGDRENRAVMSLWNPYTGWGSQGANMFNSIPIAATPASAQAFCESKMCTGYIEYTEHVLGTCCDINNAPMCCDDPGYYTCNCFSGNPVLVGQSCTYGAEIPTIFGGGPCSSMPGCGPNGPWDSTSTHPCTCTFATNPGLDNGGPANCGDFPPTSCGSSAPVSTQDVQECSNNYYSWMSTACQYSGTNAPPGDPWVTCNPNEVEKVAYHYTDLAKNSQEDAINGRCRVDENWQYCWQDPNATPIYDGSYCDPVFTSSSEPSWENEITIPQGSGSPVVYISKPGWCGKFDEAATGLGGGSYDRVIWEITCTGGMDCGFARQIPGQEKLKRGGEIKRITKNKSFKDCPNGFTGIDELGNNIC